MGKTLKGLLGGEGAANVFSSLSAILLGLLAGLFVLLLSDSSQALNGFKAILVGGFVDMKNAGQVLYFATPIILTGLSVAFAYKTGLFNIGASGQFILGAFAAVYVGVEWTFLPAGLHWVTALAAAALAGALWGCIPGILKALSNANEVITCIMLNYIGMYLTNFMVKRTIFDLLKNQSRAVAKGAVSPKMWLDSLFITGASPSSANIGIFIAILAGIACYVVLDKTRFGFELKACGYNRDCSHYAGINEKKCFISSMSIAGALAGLGGALHYLAGAGKAIEVIDVLAAEGFDGIPVALLGLNNPIGVIFSGLFVAFLKVGGFNMQLYGFAPQAIEIILAVIIYCSAFSLFFKNMIAVFYKKIHRHAPEIEEQ